MTTPRIGAPELSESQVGKEETVNEIVRFLESGANLFNCLAIGTTTPPGSPTDGVIHVVGTGATGAWTGYTSGTKALYIDGQGWVNIPAHEGDFAYNQADGRLYKNNGGGGIGVWQPYSGVQTPVATDANDYTLLAADVGKYIRLTASGTKDIVIQADATEPLPANGEWHFRNVGVGDATIDDSLATVNLPAGGTLVIPQGGTVTLKRVATDEFDLFGQVTAA